MHAAAGASFSSVGVDLGVPGAVRDLEDVAEAVRRRLVGAEQPEGGRVAGDDVAQERSETRVGSLELDAGPVNLDGVVAKVGEREVLQELRRRSRAGSRSCAASPRGASAREIRHAAGLRRRRAPPGDSCEPRAQERAVARRSRGEVGDGHLMRTPRAFDLCAVDLARAGPALRRAQDDDRPARPLGLARGRARSWIAAISSRASSRAAANRWCTSAGGSSPASTRRGRQP